MRTAAKRLEAPRLGTSAVGSKRSGLNGLDRFRMEMNRNLSTAQQGATG
jgi:hypothetical protein